MRSIRACKPKRIYVIFFSTIIFCGNDDKTQMSFRTYVRYCLWLEQGSCRLAYHSSVAPSLCVIFWVPDGTQKVVSSVHWLGFYPGEDFTLVISFRSICTMRWWLLSSMWGRHPFSWEWILFLYPYDKPFVLVVRDQASIPRANRVFSSKIMWTNFVFCFAIEISRRNTFFSRSFKTDSSSTNSGVTVYHENAKHLRLTRFH